MCCAEKTEPQGLLGLVTKMAAVAPSICRSKSSRSTSHEASGWGQGSASEVKVTMHKAWLGHPQAGWGQGSASEVKHGK